MKVRALLLAVFLVVPMFAQNVVEEAKSKITKQKHDSMVEKAKNLLQRKEKIQEELSDIDAKLAKLESGQDVKEDATLGTAWYSGATSITTCSSCVSMNTQYACCR